jgi:hypothetical protein
MARFPYSCLQLSYSEKLAALMVGFPCSCLRLSYSEGLAALMVGLNFSVWGVNEG